MSQDKLRVVVVGAGIGGLTAAIALARDGHEVACFDKTMELREVGAGLQLTPNASRLLHRVGMESALRAVAVQPTVHEFHRWDDDRSFASAPITPFSEKRWGAPRYCLHRADLHAALRALVKAETLTLGARAESVTQTGDDVTLVLDNGSKYKADILIGADGLRSQVRRTLAEDAPVFARRHAFRALIPSERVPELSDSKLVVWLGPGRSVVSYPVAAGRLINVAGVTPATEDISESWTSDGRVEDVLSSFRGWNAPLLKLLASADRMLILPLYDRPPTPRWGEGRFTLLGDAAHPMFPFLAQGACQTIEDAFVLAKCLRDVSRSGVAEALRTYEVARMGRTARVQTESHLEYLHLEDGENQRARDLALAATYSDDAPHPSDWLWGYDAELDAPWSPNLPQPDAAHAT